ncbi:MAG: ATP-binding protein [Treponema sp.]|nr:ATP-binding protein [Treponema sp.]
MKSSFIPYVVILFTTVVFSAFPVFSQTTLSNPADQEHLIIATTDNGPISIDRLLYQALKNIRYSVDFVMPIVREGYIQANEGTVDGVIAGYPNLHSVYTGLIQVPVPLENINVRVFAREGSDIRINSWAELDGLQVGMLENRTYILERLARFAPNAVIIERVTNRAVLNGVVNGEFDVAVLAEREYETLGARLSVVRVGQVDQLTEYLYLNNKHEVLVPHLSAALEYMFNAGVAERILLDLPMLETGQKNTIVHIISSNIEIGREDQFSVALRKQFEDDMSVDWITVNIDARRFTRGQYSMANIAALLRADSVPRNVVAVIVSGDTALDFLKDYYYLFFRNVPVLFYGVSERYSEIILDNENHFTGIVKSIEAYETIQAALSIFPGTNTVFVVNDYTSEGKQYRNAIEAGLKPLEGRIRIEYNEDADCASLLEQINSLPEDSLVFVGSYFVDADHQYYSLGEMRRLLERNSAVPVLSVYSTDMAYNAIGGKSLDYQRYGEAIAGMLRELLDGGIAEDIPIIHDSSGFNRWVFDQNQMDRFNVRTGDLPGGAEIINRVPSVWESNPEFFIAMVVLSIVSTLLIIGIGVFLFINNRHNRQKDKFQQELQAASRAKSNFLANMSHEMRTPLTTVLGLSELTLETVQLDDETHSNLVKVYRAGETILNLVNDILDISKIEADRLELHPREYDVPSLLNDAISQSIMYIGDKPVELILNIHEDLPNYLYGDELRIKQILNNLLSNAFKFTREGTVELGLRSERCHDDTVLLTAWVRDTGIGIKPEDMGKLFTLYAKMEEESRNGSVHTGSFASRRTEGTGLGLSISKRVAEMMGGSITVESEYHTGSVFTVKLKQQYVSDAVIGPDIAESLKKFDYSIRKFDSVKMTRINMSYARVLIVDDNPTNLDVAKGLMGLYGMKIDCVTGGQQAIDAIRSEKVRYNAVFLDHMMPEMDGIEAARVIRENIGSDYAQTVPLIALTANAIIGNREMFLSKGFQDFISKPIDLARLDTVLRQWVRDKDAEALLPDQLITIGTGKGKERQILLEDIPGLDLDKGIAHFGFNEEAYLNVLQSIVRNTRPLLDLISKVTEDNLDQYAVTVHGIKGSLRGIFAENAGDTAETLEKAAVAGDYNFVNSANQKFLDIILQLLTDIENVILKSEKNQKPVREKPDDLILADLLKSCESYDIDKIDAAMAEIECCEYSRDEGLAAWLRDNVDQGKYGLIIDKLSSLRDRKEV